MLALANPVSIQLLANSSSSSSTIDDAVNGVSGIAKLINEYGLECILISVFICIIIVWSIIIFKVFNKMIESQLNKNTSYEKMSEELIKNVIDGYFSKKENEDKDEKEKAEKNDYKEKHLVSNFNYANMSITDASRAVMGETHCSRVAVYVFHNGNSSPYGFPFVRVSCISEFTMKGTITPRGTLQNTIPLHAISNIVKSLVENGEYVIGNIYNHGIINSDDQLMEFVSGSLTKAIYALPIIADNGEITAFTIVEFNDEEDFSVKEFYDTVHNALETMNKTIRSILIDEDFKTEAIAQHGTHQQ